MRLLILLQSVYSGQELLGFTAENRLECGCLSGNHFKWLLIRYVVIMLLGFSVLFCRSCSYLQSVVYEFVVFWPFGVLYYGTNHVLLRYHAVTFGCTYGSTTESCCFLIFSNGLLFWILSFVFMELVYCIVERSMTMLFGILATFIFAMFHWSPRTFHSLGISGKNLLQRCSAI